MSCQGGCVYLPTCVDTEVNSPGPHVPPAVCCVVANAVEQGAVHLRYVLRAQGGVRGAVGTNACLHTHSDGGSRMNTDYNKSSIRGDTESDGVGK